MTGFRRAALVCLLVFATDSLTLRRAHSAESAAAATDTPEYWRSAQRELAQLADGVLVWESRRTGQWRIWTLQLDGSGLRQLTADEPGCDHYCPKLAPDGKRLVYLSLPDEAQKNNLDRPRDMTGVLHLINVDGSGDRVIAAAAQKYNGWDRAVTWFDDQHLAFIDGDGNTQRLNLATAAREPLIRGGQCWLPNTRLTHAVWSFNTFSLLNADTQTVTPMPHLGGCQPYFTHDGLWGFWVRAPGGPLYKMHLATRAIAPLFDRSLLPSGRDYCYFPMVSLNQRLLAFAAADHNRIIGEYGGYVLSDYDVFVLPIDPGTLEPVGKPIRYTFDPHCDRFPDVYQAEPALGYQSNEAPFSVQFPAAPAGATWNFGDGSPPQPGDGRHTYDRPGVYLVEARSGERVLRGQVRVAQAIAPTVTGVVLEGDRELVAMFSEPVDLTNVKVQLASGAGIERTAAGDDGRSLRVLLQTKPQKNDRLTIEGVTDRAQRPNRLDSAAVEVIARTWPSNPAGLTFLWETADKPNKLRDPLEHELVAYAAKFNNRAWLDRNRAMVLDGGDCYFGGLGDRFANAVRKSGELSIELTLTPAKGQAAGSQCLMTCGPRQLGDKLVLPLGGTQTELCTLEPGETSHLVVTYRPGEMNCYRNGQMVLATDRVRGALAGYPSGPLNIGNNLDGQAWRGTVEGIALYNRVLPPEEALANANAYRQLRRARPDVTALRAELRLAASSAVPQLKQIEPYRQALVVNEYDVLRVIEGEYATPKIRVAHWGMLDELVQPAARLPSGESLTLTLEPFVDQPQLEDQYTHNTLEEDFDLPLYYSPMDELPSHAVARWNVLGLDGGDAKGALDKAAGPEGRRGLPAAFSPADGRAWQTVEADRQGYINLIGLPHASGGLGYAVAYVNSPTKRQAVISAATVGGIKCWVNGVEVLAGQFGRYPYLGAREATVELAAGWNEILVKTTQLYAFWGFRCELLSPEGKAMPDLSYATHP